MQQKSILLNGRTLYYLEVNEDKNATIFFIHGNSGSSASWKNQLESNKLSDFRMIAIDLPGHGNSDAALNPENDYSPITLGTTMAAAVTTIAKNRPYLLVGFSLGTNIVGEMLSNHLNPVGIALISSCAIETISDLQHVFLPNPLGGLLFNDTCPVEDLNQLAAACFYFQTQPAVEQFKADFQKTKQPFRSALGKKAAEGAVSNELESINNTALPLLIVFGKEDQILNVNYLDKIELSLLNNTIFKLPEAGHFVQVDQSDAVNKLLSDYAHKQFTAVHI